MGRSHPAACQYLRLIQLIGIRHARPQAVYLILHDGLLPRYAGIGLAVLAPVVADEFVDRGQCAAIDEAT
jgi:hypothetical protein